MRAEFSQNVWNSQFNSEWLQLISCHTFAPSRRLSRKRAVDDGERGRLDRSRRRPADELAALALAQQTVDGICRTTCSARRRTERPGRSRSPFPTASLIDRELYETQNCSSSRSIDLHLPSPLGAITARRSAGGEPFSARVGDATPVGHRAYRGAEERFDCRSP